MRAAIYLRISLDQTGEGLAIERQREDCERIANERGWSITETYTDTVSASKRDAKRPGYDRLVHDFAAERFDALICYDLDRLTRQPRQLEDWIDAAERRGLKLVTANGEADLQTDGGRVYARVKAAFARGEIERKSARQTRAAKQRSELGKPPLGVRLMGYAVDGKIIQVEAKHVRYIFKAFLAGETLKGIATKLDADGVPTRSGSRWSSSTVSTILRNPRYAGHAIYQGEPTGEFGNWKPLITPARFDAVQAKLADPARITNRVGTDRRYLGGSLFLCGICERTVRTNSARYWCPRGGHVTRSVEAIDELVLSTIRERLSRPDAATLVTPRDEARIEALNERVDGLSQRLRQFESDYDNGFIDGKRYRDATSAVNAQLEGVQRERASLFVHDELGTIIGGPNPADAFDASSTSIKRAIIENLVFVRLYSAPRGRKTFDPSTVDISWRLTEVTGYDAATDTYTFANPLRNPADVANLLGVNTIN